MIKELKAEIKNVRPALQQTHCYTNQLFKKCSKCKTTQPVNNYYINKKNNDGYKSQCKKCHAIGNNERCKRFYIENTEKRKEYHKNYIKKFPEKKTKGNVIEQRKRRRENLIDAIVAVSLSKKMNMPYLEVKQMKPLLQLKRQILKIKRYVKQQSS